MLLPLQGVPSNCPQHPKASLRLPLGYVHNVTILSFILRVRPYITFANIGINLQTSKKMREKLQKCLELSEILRIFADIFINLLN